MDKEITEAKAGVEDIDKPKGRPGRPPLYSDPDVLQAKIDEYFKQGVPKRQMIVGKKPNQQILEVEVPTITGLCLYVGFADRESFCEYEKQNKFKDEDTQKAFSLVIKKARAQIATHYEQLIQSGNPAGPIFALKNMGWTDRQDIDVSGSIKVDVVSYKSVPIKDNKDKSA